MLDGVFSDEHGDYPAGTYVRNPPGSRHSPRTAPGCTLLVKLRQMKSTERQRVVIDTTSPIGGHRRAHLVLFTANGEHVSIERLEAGASADGTECPDGEEIFILAGDPSTDTAPVGRAPGSATHRLSSAVEIHRRRDVLAEAGTPARDNALTTTPHTGRGAKTADQILDVAET